ncbi:499_t:CDS:2 [Diversispora eburnea]|uniref:499_t:CDS:1 n=1 Tax=Diversispora eburnea TaxID=1213867 RepID=A0A9N8YLT7_9GLOM|nr:499_t:CDS:2 [Diversispora eburnea]
MNVLVFNLQVFARSSSEDRKILVGKLKELGEIVVNSRRLSNELNLLKGVAFNTQKLSIIQRLIYPLENHGMMSKRTQTSTVGHSEPSDQENINQPMIA